jgi:hypothetical protein
VLKQNDAPPARARRRRAHQPGRAPADDNHVRTHLRSLKNFSLTCPTFEHIFPALALDYFDFTA